MTRTITTNIPNLKQGDIVHIAGGGRVLVLEDAHAPSSLNGPASYAVCDGEVLSGEVAGYYRPGSTWRLQGNYLATIAKEIN